LGETAQIASGNKGLSVCFLGESPKTLLATAPLGHSSPYVAATVYPHALKGRDREAARKWEQFQKKSASTEPGSADAKICVTLCDRVAYNLPKTW
jgi:hypothetical protein